MCVQFHRLYWKLSEGIFELWLPLLLTKEVVTIAAFGLFESDRLRVLILLHLTCLEVEVVDCERYYSAFDLFGSDILRMLLLLHLTCLEVIDRGVSIAAFDIFESDNWECYYFSCVTIATISHVLLLLHLASLKMITKRVTIAAFGLFGSDRLRGLLFLYLASLKLKWQSHNVCILS